MNIAISENYIRRQAEDMSSRVYFPFAMLTPDMWSLQKENLCGAWKHLWERFDRNFPYKESDFLYKCFQYTEKETRKLVTIIMQVLPKGQEKDTEMIVVLHRTVPKGEAYREDCSYAYAENYVRIRFINYKEGIWMAWVEPTEKRYGVMLGFFEKKKMPVYRYIRRNINLIFSAVGGSVYEKIDECEEALCM